MIRGACQQLAVGSLADSEGVLPNAPLRKRTVQHQSGAPGCNRTSDTRFRKHPGLVLVVVNYVQRCCTVQGSALTPCCVVLGRSEA
jgi:hypothetical protein